MTVRFGAYPVPFHGGIDAKSDPKSVRPPFLRDLADLVYSAPGVLEKRPGSHRLRNEDVDGNELPDARALGVRQDELVRFNDDRCYTYNEALNRWADRGPILSITPTLQTVAFAPATQRLCDVAVREGIAVYAWEDSRSVACRYAIYDEATGAAILADAGLAQFGKHPRVVSLGSGIHIYYWIAASLYKKTILLGDLPGSLSTPAVEVLTDGNISEPAWDIVAAETGGFIAYRGTSELVVRRVHTDGSMIGTRIAIAEDPARGVGLALNEDDDRLYVGWCTSTAARFALRAASDLSSVAAAASHAAGTDFYGVTAAWAGSTCHAFWEERPTGEPARNMRVYKEEVSTAGATSGDLDLRHAGLAGHAFEENGSVFVMLVFDSTLQPTNFLYRGDDMLLVGKVLAGEAEGQRTKAWMARPIVVDRVAQMALAFKRRLDTASILRELVDEGSDPAVQFADLGIKRIDLDFADGASHRVAPLGRALYVSGLQLWQYDGGPAPVECGFHLFPENVVLQSQAAGAIPVGSYAYRVYDGWVNDKGEVELSSTAQTIVVAVASSAKKNTLRIPTLTHTLKKADRDRVDTFKVVFRSKLNPFQQSPLFRCSSSIPTDTGDNGFVWNDPDADYVDFTDNMLDEVLALNERDYISDGELERAAPPVGTILAGGKDRLYIAGFEDGNKILASTLRFDGRGAAFAGDLEILVDSAGGPVTGLEVMDDRLIIFKRDRSLIVVGDGPSNTAQGQWEQAQRVTGDVGCIDQRSIAQAPIGIVFQSAKGIRLLDRTLQVSYLGDRVERFNGQTITAAVALADDDLIIFLTDEGRALVFDYELKVWTTWRNYLAVDAALWKNQLVRATPDGRVLVKDDDVYTEDGALVGWLIEFPHLQPAGPQGFVQVKRAVFIGQYHAPHKLRAGVCYDMEPIYDRFDDWDPDAELGALTYWGDGAFWGDAEAWGGTRTAIEHFEASMPRQKCFAFGLKLEEIPGDTGGRGFALVGLVCEVAGQPGVYRLRDAVRVAVSAGGGGGGPGGGPRRSG